MEAVATAFLPIQQATCGGADLADGDNDSITDSPPAQCLPSTSSAHAMFDESPSGTDSPRFAPDQHTPVSADGDGELRQGSDWWGPIGTTQLAASILTPEGEVRACTVTRARAAATVSEPVEPAAALTLVQVLARVEKMFVVGNAAVVPSGVTEKAAEESNDLVVLVDKVASDWSEAHVAALKASFVNFDRDVGRGWLCCDALGLPFVGRSDAFSVGSAVRKRAKKVNAQVESLRRAPLRNASKLDADTRQKLVADAETAVNELLRAGVDPPLPLPAAPAAPAPLPSPATASVKRKRALSVQQQQDAERRRQVERVRVQLSQPPPPPEPVAAAAGLRTAMRSRPDPTPPALLDARRQVAAVKQPRQPPVLVPLSTELAEEAARDRRAAKAAEAAALDQLERDSACMTLRSALVQSEQAYTDALRAPFFAGWHDVARAAGDAADAASAAWDTGRAAALQPLKAAYTSAHEEFHAACDDVALPTRAMLEYLAKAHAASDRYGAMQKAWPSADAVVREQHALQLGLRRERESAFSIWEFQQSRAARQAAAAAEESDDEEAAALLEDVDPWQECEWHGGGWERGRDGIYYYTPPSNQHPAKVLPHVEWDGERFVCRREMLCPFDCRAVSRLHVKRAIDAARHAHEDKDGRFLIN